MDSETMMDKLTTIGADIMILKRSKDRLFKGYLSKAKIRGVVCSQNKSIKDYKEGSSGLSCQSNLLEAAGSAKVGSILKMQCPGDCAKQKQYKIFGKGTYSGLSSICRAAVHMAVINDIEGGLVEVKVMEGLTSYAAAFQNDIPSAESVGAPSDKAFQVVNKPLEKTCPNLKPPAKKSFLSFNEIIEKI